MGNVKQIEKKEPLRVSRGLIVRELRKEEEGNDIPCAQTHRVRAQGNISLKITSSFYEVDPRTRTYQFFVREPTPPHNTSSQSAIGMSTQEIPKGDLLPHPTTHSHSQTPHGTHKMHTARTTHTTPHESLHPPQHKQQHDHGNGESGDPKRCSPPSFPNAPRRPRPAQHCARAHTPHNTNTNTTMGMASQGPKGAPLPHSQMHHCSTHPITITYPSPDGLADQKGSEELIERGGEGRSTHTPSILTNQPNTHPKFALPSGAGEALPKFN